MADIDIANNERLTLLRYVNKDVRQAEQSSSTAVTRLHHLYDLREKLREAKPVKGYGMTDVPTKDSDVKKKLQHYIEINDCSFSIWGSNDRAMLYTYLLQYKDTLISIYGALYFVHYKKGGAGMGAHPATITLINSEVSEIV